MLGVCGTLALSTNALAGEPPLERNLFALEAFAPYRLGDDEAEQRRVQRERGSEKRERNRGTSGPFHPLAGKPDYGTADNAFGAARSGHVHAGQDVFAPVGTPLVAVSDAVVAEVGSDGGQGNYVYLYDRRRNQTYVYMHMVGPAKVHPGARVRAGSQVGAVGCTGSCWGDHLHFEVHAGKGIGGEPRDPMPLLERWERPRS